MVLLCLGVDYIKNHPDEPWCWDAISDNISMNEIICNLDMPGIRIDYLTEMD